MINILVTILQILLFIILLITIILLFIWSIDNLKSKVPFFSSPFSVLDDVKNILAVDDSSEVYDLGCGDGRVLFYLSKFNKKAKYFGIEKGLFPFLLSKIGAIRNLRKEKVSVNIIHGDFFKQDLSGATHIFIYLYPNVMDELFPKFEKELKPGTKVVSLSFQFSGRRPIAEIDLNRSQYKLGRKIFVYQF